MAGTNKHWLTVSFACALVALAACATPESGTTAASQAPARSTMGASPYVPTAASPSVCMKGEALPPECEILFRK
jgi:hypothetical protein